jgi:hypothetical protein
LVEGSPLYETLISEEIWLQQSVLRRLALVEAEIQATMQCLATMDEFINADKNMAATVYEYRTAEILDAFLENDEEVISKDREEEE